MPGAYLVAVQVPQGRKEGSLEVVEETPSQIRSGRAAARQGQAGRPELSRGPQGPWTPEVMASGKPIGLCVDIYDDRKDDGSKKLWSVSYELASPYRTQSHAIGSGPVLHFEVRKRPVPKKTGEARGPRVAEGTPTRATLSLRKSVRVSLPPRRSRVPVRARGCVCPRGARAAGRVARGPGPGGVRGVRAHREGVPPRPDGMDGRHRRRPERSRLGAAASLVSWRRS
ncbi:MAG: hypothetical protein HY744_32120 [Deltaproteobacteria bacterium]|nr:hypothetical protein [Deltaproteobacteria bacterium]